MSTNLRGTSAEVLLPKINILEKSLNNTHIYADIDKDSDKNKNI